MYISWKPRREKTDFLPDCLPLWELTFNEEREGELLENEETIELRCSAWKKVKRRLSVFGRVGRVYMNILYIFIWARQMPIFLVRGEKMHHTHHRQDHGELCGLQS
ncbi:uncharacterized protein LOC143661492 isoform X2 [Tamandua tetradactyla]|uniref:uncharacterized protein LOC143661492 isoform X2 n=1 Tax=Tamandua tetradactyla TaxID=48850 RepID=UPI0040548FCF